MGFAWEKEILMNVCMERNTLRDGEGGKGNILCVCVDFFFFFKIYPERGDTWLQSARLVCKCTFGGHILKKKK